MIITGISRVVLASFFTGIFLGFTMDTQGA